MKAWDTIKNFFMPEVGAEEGALEDEYIQEHITAVKSESERVQVKQTRKQVEYEDEAVANGTTGVSYFAPQGTASVAADRLRKAPNPVVMRPHAARFIKRKEEVAAKAQELNISIYAPKTFDDVRVIADDIRALKATVVNYDAVEPDMQRRICDFMNGACYVLDGEVRRISENMVLYVPAGVTIDELPTSSNDMFSMN